MALPAMQEDSSVGCDPGTHQIDVAVVIGLTVDLVNEILSLRPGTDERHVTLEHIPELRKLIEMV